MLEDEKYSSLELIDFDVGSKSELIIDDIPNSHEDRIAESHNYSVITVGRMLKKWQLSCLRPGENALSGQLSSAKENLLTFF